MDFIGLLNAVSLQVASSISPELLICNHVHLEETPFKKLVISSLLKKEVPIAGRIFIVGFGKGALHMAHGIDKILTGCNIESAVISTPGVGGESCNLHLPSCYKVVEAAPTNIPDSHSALAGKLIVELLMKLESSDLLIVLISGGGSALVTCPVPSISVDDLSKVVKFLHLAGAPIEHLNSVRQQLDLLKAGGLAVLAYPARVLAFILSDVVGSDIDVIASGPTSLRLLTSPPSYALDILKKYSLDDAVPSSVLSFLSSAPTDPSYRLNYLRAASRIPDKIDDLTSLGHVSNVIIGSNMDALKAGQRALSAFGIPSVIFEEGFVGDASQLGQRYAILAFNTCRYLLAIQKNEKVNVELNSGIMEKISSSAKIVELSNGRKYFMIALLSGGESTVVVKGPGKGGRNQEAALASSICLDELWVLKCPDPSLTCSLMYLASDGQDGPTNAAGAIATPDIIPLAKSENLDPSSALFSNDSFTFWSSLSQGRFHICTGPTGTNVADIILLLAAVSL